MTATSAGEVYPDQSLYPANSAPALVKRINNALRRADQIQWSEGNTETDWFVPIVADGEAGFGGALNVFELTKSFIEAGAAGVHFEDQLASEKKCGHMGGKVLVPTGQHIRTLQAARLAADVLDVPLVIVARTDANSATLLTSDIDERDRRFVTGERTAEGFFRVHDGLDSAIARGLAYAPYCDLLWCETAHPDLDEARTFADAIHAEHPGKMLAYNCSPSFNWSRHLDRRDHRHLPEGTGDDGVSLPVHHPGRVPRPQRLDVRTGSWLRRERDDRLCRAPEPRVRHGGRRLHRDPHQREVGAGYFDLVSQAVSGGAATTRGPGRFHGRGAVLGLQGRTLEFPLGAHD